jgi:iron complex transport system ATP-binding protein
MLLEVNNIKLKLKSSEILSEITFKVKGGEMVALLGPNGSGKTTILRTIFGILRPSSGAVYLDGKKIAEMRIEEIARYLGYLPQENPPTGLRVLDVVLLGRTPYNKRPTKTDIEIAEQSLKEVGLEDFEERAFSQLSGGEKQKVLLARIFAQRANVYLLDEPTAHLDISAQIEIMEILRERMAHGSSSLIAIHDINLAATFCDRILMVKDGRIAYAGEPEDVITPASIKDVFGTDVIVGKQTGKLFVIPVFQSRMLNKGKHIHVICGGGSGKNIIQILHSAGYSVSAGVLNALDSDHEAIAGIGEVVSEAPFSPIGEKSHQKNIELIECCDAVVLANLYVGTGNVLNLHAAMKAAELGKLIVINSTPFSERNFCGKDAEGLFKRILGMSKSIVREEDVLRALNELLD